MNNNSTLYLRYIVVVIQGHCHDVGGGGSVKTTKLVFFCAKEEVTGGAKDS